MKVPPKRKGNGWLELRGITPKNPSMKVPPKRKGNSVHGLGLLLHINPSMKVPPKRKGNPVGTELYTNWGYPLNESPSEKEGK